MSSENSQRPQREQLEARLTALLLGELPADEAFALGRLIEQDAELAKTFERFKKTIVLVKETQTPVASEISKPAPMKMSATKREALLRQFKTVKPKAFSEPKRRNLRLLELAAVLAILGLLAGMLLPAVSHSSKSRAQRLAANKDHLQFGTWANENGAAVPMTPASASSSSALADGTRGVPNESQATDLYIVSGGAEQKSPPPSPMDTVQFANAGPPMRASAKTDVGGLALDDDLLARRRVEPPQKKLPEVAMSGGGGGGAGGMPKRDLRGPIVLPANNDAISPGVPPVVAYDLPANEPPQIVQGFLGTVTNSGAITLGPDAFSQFGASDKEQLGRPAFGLGVTPLPQTNAIIANYAFYSDLDANGKAEHGVGPMSATSPIAQAIEMPAAAPEVTVDPATGLPLPAVEQRYYRVDPNVMAEKLKEAETRRESVAASPAEANTGIAGTGIHNITRTNSAGAQQDAVRGLPAKDGLSLDPTKGESLYYNDRSGAIIVNGTSQNQAKMQLLAGSFGDAVSTSSETINSIVLPSNSVDFGINTSAGSEPMVTFKNSTAYQNRSRSAGETTRGATVLMDGDTRQSFDVEKDKQQLAKAERNLDELKRFGDLLAIKQSTEKIQSRFPKTSTVEIMDDATPAPKPSTSLWGKLTGKPAEYDSKAKVRINRDTTDIPLADASKLGTAYDPYFIQTEFETIQSEPVLSNAVAQLDLKNAWGKKYNHGTPLSTPEAIRLLKGKLDFRPLRNTSYLEIHASSDKPEEAAAIANAVAKSYQKFRQGQSREMAKSGVAVLEGQIADQEKKISDQKKVVAQLQQQLGLSIGAPTAPTQVAQGSIKDDAVKEDKALPKPAVPPPTPQPEVETTANPFSTFSLNVSDVSFKLAAASLEKGVLPEPASIRSEEFINAFDYRDPEPPANVPVAFASERAQYPFAQNRDLLRFSIKTAAQGREAGKPLNLVLLVDNSGSMERADRVRILRESLLVLAAQLKKEDRFSIITFARAPHLRVDGISGDQAPQAVDQVSGLTPEGGTNLEEGMNLAYQTAARHYLTNGLNRVVLMTDGAANLGDVTPESLKQKVEANRKQGIALDCFGIGWEGYNDDLLEVLSRNGDGRYGFINTPEEASSEFASQLAGALNVAASDVKVQVEFNPRRTTAYRQIGYAKHQLTKEQFRDNTVDAAEIGAAEGGNALYVIQTNPNGEGPIATVRVRFKVPGTTDNREHEWAVAYTGAAVPLEQASPAMRLAASASAFSEWLATSPYAAEVTTDALLRYLSGVPDVYGADGRPKKLEWMIRQARAVSGK